MIEPAGPLSDVTTREAPHRRSGGRDPGGYVDLASYAAIGDGRAVALVALDGRIDWLPLPDLDSPPVFGALLDADNGGFIELRPDAEFRVEREYVRDTNVLATTFFTATGSVRITDSMNTGVAGRLPWAELGRRIDGLDGTVTLRAEVRPGTCLNTASPWVRDTAAGPVVSTGGVMLSVRQLGAEVLDVDGTAIRLRYLTSPGSRQLLGLVATEGEPLFVSSPEAVDAGVGRTIDNWRSWTANFCWDGPHADQVRRSALALKLLIHSPTGAIAAAATTSLPESPAGDNNWDYRFTWVRDAAYALHSLFRFGLREEVHGAISWLLRTMRANGPDPHIFFRLGGATVDDKVTEHDVPGWRGIGPVISGNRASTQLQLGVFGDVFSIVTLYVEEGNVLDADTGRLLAALADSACDRWRSKDSGMWELEEQRHYTTSKLGCWVALRRAVDLHEAGQIPGDPTRWRAEADRIRTWVDENCWSEARQAYVWYAGTDQLDASIVLHAISGFDRGTRMSTTLDALRAELGTGPHLHRYSGADTAEGAFVACSFWMVSALHLVGRTDEARALLDELMDTPNDVGMLSEIVDPVTGEFWGNLPQALSHLALINAALTIAEPPAEG